MKMRTKVISGFSVVIILLVLMGILGVMQILGALNGFGQYRNFARDANLASDLRANMLLVRLYVKDFIINGDQEAIDQYNQYRMAMHGFLDDAKTEILNPTRAALIKKVEENLKSYESAFNEVMDLQAQRTELVNEYLNLIGPLMEERVSHVLLAAQEDKDTNATFNAALALQHLLLGRLAVVKYLEANNESAVGVVKTEFEEFQHYLEVIDYYFRDYGLVDEYEELMEYKKVYLEKFNLVVEDISQRNLKIESVLDVEGPKIASWVAEVAASVEEDQFALGTSQEKSNRRSLILILLILFIAVVAGITIALVTINSVLKQLGGDPSVLERISDEIARGDVRIDPSINVNNELGVYQKMLNMKMKLSEIVSNVLTGTEQIATSSEQLASGNQDLSNRTEQQASALEETSAAIEEMNASVKSNADNTTSADQLSREAVNKTNQGAQSVEKMIQAMNEINESSNRIADIIEVINNIAFQTNLLALNASIEAARAGEQGKGFAVVAVEVRKLAKRSDKAAGEIAEIIKNSNKKVEEGVSIANVAGEMLQEINMSVNKVTSLVAEIAAATQEQLSSVNEIDSTLSNLDENTQKNATMVEEAASATEELSSQAQELNTLMQFFTIDTGSPSSRAPVRQLAGPESRNTGITQYKEKSSKKTASKSSSAKSKSDKSELSSNYETFSDLADQGEFEEY
ncbi:HAMP domain-containing methyl-accepting chemotaxis protein [Spirochaeta cellobiosiphila]|uniref:HAMP domain-containing methyl-accepting chemotaxis protein n=1 Tax=Spirochaeta cellobiosiphila TaxID=504483 RepID=UPI0003FFAF4B|nr:methyl-accepting chemotaxis protein [Spirochaeta cellobiosiphila]